eukprot:comp15517_c1_seq1/m.12542 comp15517_c1_seq1/g.12542  ORF comp15517_c1_seq1/g.12542 comp15517_c1_seq1/m.12542 type:complete len:138 (-) comp15517_c1_seq1:380-793(-)
MSSPPPSRVRKKVPLKPGRGLMDWVRLAGSGQDLTGVSGVVREISLEELAKHNTPKDAWMAVRGRVYNVTHFIDFHPGGAEELLRGAGIDATELFDEYHKWVNIENMMKACVVGYLPANIQVHADRNSLNSAQKDMH